MEPTESGRQAASESHFEEAIFAAGCFWGVEAAFRGLTGVVATEVGYTGGTTQRPTYEAVCAGGTGHAEAVRLRFDPAVVSYAALLAHFWDIHDPTQRDRQGPDIGAQYRSAIFYHGETQRRLAEESNQARAAALAQPITTQIMAAGPFWPAEAYHQQYAEKRRAGVSPLRNPLGA